MIDTVSGGGFVTTVVTPFTLTTLLSLPGHGDLGADRDGEAHEQAQAKRDVVVSRHRLLR